jgi:hypothetical protein
MGFLVMVMEPIVLYVNSNLCHAVPRIDQTPVAQSGKSNTYRLWPFVCSILEREHTLLVKGDTYAHSYDGHHITGNLHHGPLGTAVEPVTASEY